MRIIARYSSFGENWEESNDELSFYFVLGMNSHKLFKDAEKKREIWKCIKMDNIVSSRSEIIFLYDVKDANPNGDPLDENKPRIDEETGINIVTDVRLKRTIRDYLQSKDKKIFVKEIIYDEDGHIQDAKMRAGDFGNDRKRILEECIDIRLFGGVLPIIKSKKEKAKKDNGTESNAGKYTESKEDKGAIT